ncbi:12944_t:CDS:1, partial [Funneliformis geosporum]
TGRSVIENCAKKPDVFPYKETQVGGMFPKYNAFFESFEQLTIVGKLF